MSIKVLRPTQICGVQKFQGGPKRRVGIFYILLDMWVYWSYKFSDVNEDKVENIGDKVKFQEAHRGLIVKLTETFPWGNSDNDSS